MDIYDIEKKFKYLVEHYGMQFVYKKYDNYYGQNYDVHTYSYYNKSGCFTIYTLPSRGELEFYYSKQYGEVLDCLKDRCINIYSEINKDEWPRNAYFLGFSNPLFWFSYSKILEGLSHVIKEKIKKNGTFFGIDVK